MKIISFLSCLLYAAALTEGAIIKADGFQGRNVSFKCSHTFAWTNNKYFCKGPCERAEDLLVTVGSGRRAQSGRITLVDSGDGSFTVTFSHLQLSDSQKYWCGVDRFGLDTYTEIQLTVKKAPETETTARPDVTSTWADQNTNTTELTTGAGTMKPTKLSTTLNITAGEPEISTGTIVYAIVGGVKISILLLAVCFRKFRNNSKHTPEVYCNVTELRNANQSEVSRWSSDTGKGTKQSKKLSQRTSLSTHQHRRDPPTSEPRAASSIPAGIYGNTSLSKLPAGAGYSPTEDQIDYDDKSAIHINFKAPSESTKEDPRSLWFGLDISRINLS